MATVPLYRNCWPVDWACNPDLAAEVSTEMKALAEGLATQTLRMLTGFRVGGCPVTVRPCNRSCIPGSWLTAPDLGSLWAGTSWFGLSPFVGPNGAWLNACGCRTDDCSCVKVQEILLPGNVGRVDEVFVDGAVLDPSAYRVDNNNRLVRQDGGQWPVCQDMNLPQDDPEAWYVTYLDGNPVDEVGSYVAGLLAAEYAKACAGGQCALPANVTSVTRQGINMQMEPEVTEDMFPGGMTGIKAVDQWVQIWNPTMTLPAGIYSPDYKRGRRTTWSA